MVADIIIALVKYTAFAIVLLFWLIILIALGTNVYNWLLNFVTT